MMTMRPIFGIDDIESGYIEGTDKIFFTIIGEDVCDWQILTKEEAQNIILCLQAALAVSEGDR
jgi:hypothetical protein